MLYFSNIFQFTYFSESDFACVAWGDNDDRL